MLYILQLTIRSFVVIDSERPQPSREAPTAHQIRKKGFSKFTTTEISRILAQSLPTVVPLT